MNLRPWLRLIGSAGAMVSMLSLTLTAQAGIDPQPVARNVALSYLPPEIILIGGGDSLLVTQPIPPGSTIGVSSFATINVEGPGALILSPFSFNGSVQAISANNGAEVSTPTGITGGFEWLYKDGNGTLDLRSPQGSNNASNGTVLAQGTIIIDDAGDLGGGSIIRVLGGQDGPPFPGALGSLSFVGDSTLAIDTSNGPVDLTGAEFNLVAPKPPIIDPKGPQVGIPPLSGGIVTTVEVMAGDAATMDFASIASDSDENVLRKIGAGELILEIDSGDTTPTPLPPGVSKCESALLTTTEILFAAEEGAILDPAIGTVTIDNSGNARTTVIVAGLGNTVNGALSTGTLNLLNANIVIQGSVPTFFGGNITGNANIGIDDLDLSFDAANPDFTGQIVVRNNATLTVGDALALGAFGNIDANGTYVCAGSTLALNDLSLGASGPTISERITLFNNAELINNGGNNFIDSMLLVEHDINGSPNQTTAHIGVRNGSLRLTGGIEDHFTDNDMSLSLNTRSGETGTLMIASQIGASIQDVTIGHGTYVYNPMFGGGPPNSSVVRLTENNQYAGSTYLNGGLVILGDQRFIFNVVSPDGPQAGIVPILGFPPNQAFSTGLVTVQNDTAIEGAGVTLGNTFQLNPGTTLSLLASEGPVMVASQIAGVFPQPFGIEITGVIQGSGGLQTLYGEHTLSGENTYSGPTNVRGGSTLNIGNTLASSVLNIDADGILNTTQPNVLSDSAEVTVNGALDLGGDEAIRSIAGAGTIDINDFSFGVRLGNFDGTIIGEGNVDKSGPGTLTLNGPQSFLGDLKVLDGVVRLGAGGGLATTGIEIADGGTLDTGGNEQIVDNADLQVDGLLDLGGDETIGTLNGGTTGVVDLNTFGLTVSDGTFDGQITNAHGDLNKVGGGTLNLGGTSTYNGTTHVEAGTLHLTPTGQLTLTDIVEVDAGATLSLSGVGVDQLNNAAALDINGTMNLAGDETVGSVAATGILNGPGELTAATYDLDGATVNADLGNGALTSTGNTDINGKANVDSAVVTGGTLTVDGAGALTNNTADVTVNGGAILQADGTIAADNVTVDGGGTLNTGDNERLNDSVTLVLDGALNLGGNETIGTLNDSAPGGVLNNNGFDVTVSNGLYGGDISGGGNLNKTGAGTLILNGVTLSYTGATNVLDGTLVVGNTNGPGGLGGSTDIDISNGATLTTTFAEAINDAATVNVDGTLNIGGNETITNLNGGATGEVNIGNFDLMLTGGIDFAGRINGGTGGVSAGPGDLILGGDNTFTGDLTVLDQSTVTLNGSIDGNAQINTGGALVLGSSERIADGSTVTNNGILTLSGGETLTTLNLNGLGVAGQGLLNGVGLVTATTYNLDNGATTDIGADLGLGTQNVGSLDPGGAAVTQNGDSAAQDVNVVGAGTVFNLNGRLTNVGNTAAGDHLTIGAGATMNLRNGGSQLADQINDPACVINNGFLNLNGNETVGNYAASGALGLTAGGQNPSTLTAATYNLYNGASTAVGANLGEGVLSIGIDKFNMVVPGVVTLNGDSAAETATVYDGAVFNLNGELTDVLDLTINTGGTTTLGAPERINDDAVVNNNGTLNLNGVENITIYNSTGTLGGTGTLIADTYNLEAGSVTNAGADLGAGDLSIGCNIAGTIVLNGDSASEDVTVCAGSTLNLGGQLTAIGTSTTNPGDNLTIESTATLNLGAAVDQINNDGVVINDGTLNLYGPERIGTFISSGTLGLAGGAPIPSILTTQGNTITLLGGHVSLIGTGLAGAGPNPQLTSNGVVNINGTANSTVPASNATLDVSTALIQSGTMFLDGLFINTVNANPNITVNSGATLISGSADRIVDTATVTIDNGGIWNLGSGGNNGDDTITTFNAGGTLNNGGPGISTLTASTYNLTGGALINANLGTGVLNSNNNILGLSNTLNGDAAVNDANITSGTFNLNGELTVVNTVDISSGATVNLGSSERINNGAIVNNFGELDLNGAETVTTYNSSGGFLDDTGLLTAVTYNLELGASTDIGADLGNTGTFNSNGGTVTLNGNLNTDLIEINSGVLVTNGSVGNVNMGDINIDGGARWDVNGTYSYDNVRGTGTIRPNSGGGTFTNQTNLRPGDILTPIGQINIDGDYTESGSLHADLGLGGTKNNSSDTVWVDDYASLAFDSVLQLNEVGGLIGGDVLCGERWHIIDSYETRNGNYLNGYAISGGWDEITDADNFGPNGNTFGSRVLFDRGSGDVVALGLKAGETFEDYVDIDSNQTAIISAIFDGSVDSVGNYNSNDGGGGTVLNAILDNGPVGDKDSLLGALDALSPEAYAGAVDYALHATRSYAQNVMAATPQISGSNYDIVAGWSHFSLDSDSSRNNGDYDINSNGGYLGVRVNCHPDLVFGGFLAADSGSIDGSRIDLDADGYVLGGFVEWTPQGEEGPWTVWGNLAYGNYEFDGDRRGLITPRLEVSDFDADAFQLGVGVDFEAYQDACWTIIPGAGLRYIDASTDGFTESGGPDALKVGGMDQDLLLLDLAVRFIYQQAGQPWALDGSIGWQHDFSDSERDVDARLANGGGLPFTVEAPGLGDDAFTYGVGAHYDFGDRYRIGLSYRGEIRDDADAFHGLDLRVTAGF